MPWLVTAFTSLGTAIGLSSAAAATFGSIAARLLFSTAISLLQSRRSRGSQQNSGMRFEVTQNGGTTPCSFPIGTTAVVGQRGCPPYSHGTVGNTPNAYLTEIVELSDIAGCTLKRVMLDGEWVTLGSTPHADYGLPATGKYADHFWVKYYDGTQTVADPMMLAKYGTHPERPWLADMVYTGVCYAICTFLRDPELFRGNLSLRFEMGGIPLYDPRKDSTVGGVGSQRWSDKATWVPSDNPIVQDYNICRGITFADGSIWGGEIDVSRLPLANWFAAMNACDVLVNDGSGGTEPIYRTGYEVLVTDEPFDVREELLKGANAAPWEVGGAFKVRVGLPAAASVFIMDGDLATDKPAEMRPFLAPQDVINGITATYPNPATGYAEQEAPSRFNSTWEARDGGRFVTSQSFSAVSNVRQVQRLMLTGVRDHQRGITHQVPLTRRFAYIEPGDIVSWTSEENGYVNKLFEVTAVWINPLSPHPVVTLREVNPSDYDFDAGVDLLPSESPSTVSPKPPPQTVPGWDVTGISIKDDAGSDRRYAAQMTWTGAAWRGVQAIKYEIRLKSSGVVVRRGSTADVISGSLIESSGLISGTTYQARARQAARWETLWTAWVDFTTPSVRLKPEDLSEEVSTSEAGNAYPDFDMLRPAFYSTNTGADYLFRNTAAALLGSRYLEISTSAAVEQVDTGWFSLEPDTEYLIGAAAWVQVGGAGSGECNVDFQTGSVDAAGVVTPLTTNVIKTTTDQSYGLATSHGSITITSDPTARRGRFRVQRGPGGTHPARAGGFSVVKKVGESRLSANSVTVSKIAANQITAAKLNKVDLEAAGVSIFNNNLKSSNYVAGVSGWRLSHGGTLEIRNLIDRSALMADSVSDRTQSTMLAAMDVPVATNNVILTHSIGAVDFGSYILRAVVFEARNVQAGDTVFELQIRRKQYGAWGAWDVTSTWTIPGGTTAWDVYSSGNFLTGKYDDVEYRLRSTRSGVASSGIRNLYITTQNTVK